MKTYYFSIIFFILSSFIFAIDQHAVVITKSSPKICGIVDPVSGVFSYQAVDVQINSIDPLFFQRMYGSNCMSHMGDFGWIFFPHSQIAVHKLNGDKTYYLREPSGGLITYGKSNKENHKYGACSSLYVSGYTNDSFKELSGRTNLRNKFIDSHSRKEKILYTGDGTKKLYTKREEMNGFLQKLKLYYLKEETLANGNRVFYDYNEDNTIGSVRLTNPAGNVEYGWLSISYAETLKKDAKKPKKNRNFTVCSSCGYLASYHYDKIGKGEPNNKRYLKKISGTCIPENLDYNLGYMDETVPAGWFTKEKTTEVNKTRVGFVNSIKYPQESFAVQYYVPKDNYLPNGIKIEGLDATDPRCERARSISAPVGPNGKMSYLYAFIYYVDEKDKMRTNVIDLIDKTESHYWYGEDNRLKFIDYKYRTPNGSYCFIEKYKWDSGYSVGNLLEKSFEDRRENGQSVTTSYKYDNKGNVLEESFIGLISGEGDRLEKYSKKYEYFSNDLFNLPLKKKEDNGLVITYTYKSGTDLVTSKTIFDNDVPLMKQLFEYDRDNVVTREIEEDLTSNIKKIKTYILKKSHPAYNFPESIEESYINEEGEALLLSKVNFQYNNQNNVIREEVFGSDGKKYDSVFTEYDSNGQLIKKTDFLGRISLYKYDNSQKLIEKKEGNFRITEQYIYDKAGRLVTKKELSSDGKAREYFYAYDKKSNKIAESNFMGAETRYNYDTRGNLVEEILPAVINEEGIAVSSKSYQEYDGFGNEIYFIDANGSKTIRQYNAHGKVLVSSYPDGTFEYFYYNLNGTLNRTIDQEGVITDYTYDVLGRELTKKIFSNEGECLLEEENTYNYFGKTSCKNAEGYMTYYFYDGAGRKIAEEYHHNQVERTEFVYDNIGRLYKTKRCNGDNSLIEIKVYDNANRVREERQEDINGQVLTKTQFLYDDFDNLVRKISFIDGKIGTILYSYDDYKRIVKTVDSENNTSMVEYFDKDQYFQGQIVSKKISTDPLGIKTVEIYDVLNNIIFLEKYNNAEEKISSEKYIYDSRNNLVKQESEIISPYSTKSVIRKQVFDHMNRLTSLIEAAGSRDEEHVTTYSYSDKGYLVETIKPDEIRIKRSYDCLGREVTLQTSDGSCSYRYEYDLLGNLTQSTDLNSSKTTFREVDGKGRILYESMGNGQEIRRNFDQSGRCVETIFFDGSSIEKIYNSLFLKTVIRKDSSGKYKYKHCFNEYDLAGNLTKSTLINDLGKLSYKFDKLNRPVSVISEYFKHCILEYDAVSNVKKMLFDALDEASFKYDDLNQLEKEEGIFLNDYSFDSHYNRVRKNGNEYLLNDLNEIIQTEQDSYQYDLCGNTTVKKTSSENFYYYYDGLDRLIRVLIPGKMEINYSYDSFHRRFEKNVKYDNNTNDEIIYLYDANNEIAEIKNGKVVIQRILGNINHAEIGSAIAIEHEDKIYCPLHDLNGNVAKLISSDNKIVEEYRYSSFGEEKIYNIDGEEALYSINPWRFSSKRKDEETSLIYYGRRYYAPDIGRWTTTDPKGYTDSLNLYAFVMNSPLSNIDLYGLYTEDSPHAFKGMFSGAWNYATKAITNMAGNNDDFIHWDCQKEYTQYQQRQVSIDHINQSSRDWFTTTINADVNNSTFQNFEKWTERGLFAASIAYGMKNVASITMQEFNFNGNLQNVKRFLNQPIKNYGSGVFSSNRAYSGIDIKVNTNNFGLKKNPLKGTFYSEKVIKQMRPDLKTGITDFHGFPKIVDNYAKYGKINKITGRDGIYRTKINLDGSFRGNKGSFEWIIEPDNSINHRIFKYRR